MTRWIWGASEGGRLTLPYVSDCGGVVDSDRARWGSMCGPWSVHPPEAITPGDHVVIASLWARDIEAAAHTLGATTSLTPLWRSLTPPDATIDEDATETVARMLYDGHSADVYRAVLRAWRDDAVVPAGLGEVGSYDLGYLGLRPGMRVLDGGPYDGAEVRAWLAAEPDLYRVDCVDPAPQPALLAMHSAQVRVYHAALSREQGEATIHVAGPATGLERADGVTIRVSMRPLCHYDVPDLVKLDIEGAEIDVLASSADWLREYRPRLAVCIYHRMSDLWTIPLLVRDIYPDARLHVRHHSQGLPETVLYAIPEGR